MENLNKSTAQLSAHAPSLSVVSTPDARCALRGFLAHPPCSVEGNRLFRHVAGWLIRRSEDAESFRSLLSDVLAHGCSSGIVEHLIYYYDTHQFYRKYMSEIHDLLDELEGSTGEAIKTKGDRANWYAWFGFEEMAYKIEQMLEEEGVL